MNKRIYKLSCLSVFLLLAGGAQAQQPPVGGGQSPDANTAPEAPVTAAVPATPARPAAPNTKQLRQNSATKLVAVLDLRSSKDTQASARALSLLVASEVGATPGYRAISRNDLRNLLAHQSDAQMLGCDDVKCLSDIARLAAADLLVAGSVEKIENAYVFSLQLIDPVQARVLERQAATWSDDPDRIVELARPLVARILAGPAGQQMSGALEILAPEKTVINLDGKRLGLAPLKHAITGLATGPHTIEAHLDGFEPYRHQVVVVNKERSLLQVQLVDSDSLKPWYSRWWVWGSVGGGLALVGGATAAVLAYQATQNTPPTRLDLVGELPVGAE